MKTPRAGFEPTRPEGPGFLWVSSRANASTRRKVDGQENLGFLTLAIQCNNHSAISA